MTASDTGAGAAKHNHDRPLIIVRTFDAPRDLMFNVWTDPEHFKHWWGPKGCTVVASKMDLRPGGTLLYSMRMPDGPEMWAKFVYHEILAPDRLVFVSSFSDEKGNITRAPFSATWPLEITNTLILREQFDKTTLTLLSHPANATDEEWQTFETAFSSLHQGFSGTFDQLAGYLAKL